MLKECRRCKEYKSLSNFYLLKSNTSYGVVCKSCVPKLRNTYNTKRYLRYYNIEDIKSRLLSLSRQNATKRNIEHILSLDDIIIPDECPIFKRPFDDDRYKASIDRIDSSKGYVKDNVQVISLLANTMKSSASEEELKVFCSNYLLYLTK